MPDDEEAAKALREEQHAYMARWGETLGMAAALLESPQPVLERLRDAAHDVLLRVLPEVEGFDPEAALDLLWSVQGDGDDLLRLATSWPDRAAAAERLLKRVTPERSLDELAYLHYAIEGVLGHGPDRESFFRACGRWPDSGPPTLEMVPIPAGSFMMGSPDDEEGRYDWEGPLSGQRPQARKKGSRSGAWPKTPSMA